MENKPNRTKRLTLRLSSAEYAHLQAQAQAAGMKMEPLIRRLIMGSDIRPRPPDCYAALLRELSAIGNNINQIAHWANARESISGEEIRQAAALARSAWQLVRDTL